MDEFSRHVMQTQPFLKKYPANNDHDDSGIKFLAEIKK